MTALGAVLMILGLGVGIQGLLEFSGLLWAGVLMFAVGFWCAQQAAAPKHRRR